MIITKYFYKFLKFIQLAKFNISIYIFLYIIITKYFYT